MDHHLFLTILLMLTSSTIPFIKAEDVMVQLCVATTTINNLSDEVEEFRVPNAQVQCFTNDSPLIPKINTTTDLSDGCLSETFRIGDDGDSNSTFLIVTCEIINECIEPHTEVEIKFSTTERPIFNFGVVMVENKNICLFTNAPTLSPTIESRPAVESTNGNHNVLILIGVLITLFLGALATWYVMSSTESENAMRCGRVRFDQSHCFVCDCMCCCPLLD